MGTQSYVQLQSVNKLYAVIKLHEIVFEDIGCELIGSWLTDNISKYLGSIYHISISCIYVERSHFGRIIIVFGVDCPIQFFLFEVVTETGCYAEQFVSFEQAVVFESLLV